jgi:hypothetical protein
MFNISKLSKELAAAGIPFSGCNSDGVVWGPDGATEIQPLPEVAAILAAHDPAPEPPAPSLADQITALQAQIELQDQVIMELLNA